MALSLITALLLVALAMLDAMADLILAKPDLVLVRADSPHSQPLKSRQGNVSNVIVRK